MFTIKNLVILSLIFFAKIIASQPGFGSQGGSGSASPSGSGSGASGSMGSGGQTVSASNSTNNQVIITGWKKSNGTGYAGIQADVIGINYDSLYVYIRTNSIPSYSIGPWKANPNTPTAQNSTFKFYRSPKPSNSKQTMMLGPIGLWINGVIIYDGWDGYTVNNVWQRNAYFFEGISFDSCLGHPDGKGVYHDHININCYYNVSDSSKHSPLIGFMLDSYPIYGPFGYSSANDSSSAIKRIESGYSLRNITERTTLENGTLLSSDSIGPPLNATYPLGAFLQDYYWSGVGDLDQYNGRWCVTPEFPQGTYAYFVATDSNGNYAYPYVAGGSYYGNVASTRPTSISSVATKYF